MRTSDTGMTELYEALHLAQSQVKEPQRTAKADNYMYAPLDVVLKEVKPILEANGLGLIQTPISGSEGKVGVETRVFHKSGGWVESSYMLPVSKHDPQTYGSIITYFRRYAVLSFLNIAPEDDDGAAATPKTSGVANTSSRPASEKQLAYAKRLVLQKHPEQFEKTDWDNMSNNRVKEIIDRLK